MDLILLLGDWWQKIYNGLFANFSDIFGKSLNQLFSEIFGSNSSGISKFILSLLEGALGVITLPGTNNYLINLTLFELMFVTGVTFIVLFSIAKYFVDLVK